jgi:hypothetical protein
MDNNSDNNNNNNNLLKEAIKSFEFEEPCEIDNIEQPSVSEEDLREFLKKFQDLSTESKNILLLDVANNNIINPNENKFNSISMNSLKKIQLKKHIDNYILDNNKMDTDND